MGHDSEGKLRAGARTGGAAHTGVVCQTRVRKAVNMDVRLTSFSHGAG